MPGKSKARDLKPDSRGRKRALAMQTDQITDILWGLFRLKYRLKSLLLPDDLAQQKEHLSKLLPESERKRTAWYDLFRVGIVLSRQKEPVTMGDLSETSAIPLSSATRIMDWLVESGYAKRFADPEDRRIVRVALTETGQGLYQAIDEFARQRVEEILSQFTGEEQENLVLLLRKLVEVLEKMTG